MDLMADSTLEKLLLQSTPLSLISEKPNAVNITKALAIVRLIHFDKQFNVGGGYCNFMHPKHVSKDLKRQLFKAMYDEHPDYRDQRRE